MTGAMSLKPVAMMRIDSKPRALDAGDGWIHLAAATVTGAQTVHAAAGAMPRGRVVPGSLKLLRFDPE